jgi:hypothetical protein
VEADRPIVGYSRPVHFALRPAVKSQTEEKLQDYILEIGNSPILNPLTVVQRHGKKPRICVDARKVNQYTIPDYEHTPPLQELLQRFNMTSLDLSSAYLQIPLHEECRKYTAFLFGSTMYQYRRVPYGLKNSLSAFIRALKLTLGSDTEAYLVFYMDAILVQSHTFEEHLAHLGTVIYRLIQAGFTLNARKCRFFQEEVKFLGHSSVKLEFQRILAAYLPFYIIQLPRIVNNSGNFWELAIFIVVSLSAMLTISLLYSQC